jgi:alpha-ketoglutarate-dependent 2,4-dichlorophenoxyacetate dioxygenase
MGKQQMIQPMRHNSPDFVGEVSEIDTSHPLNPGQARIIEQAIDVYGVLVFRHQQLDDARQIAFARHFGPLEENDPGPQNPPLRQALNFLRSPGRFARLKAISRSRQMTRTTNRAKFMGSESHDGVGPLIQPIDGSDYLVRNMLWHTDSSFKPTPARYSLLYARTLPAIGGNTEFADMRAAWDALDLDDKVQAQDLVCRHSERYSYEAVGHVYGQDMPVSVPQRLVRRHPRTGRYNLYLASHAGGIVGWPTPQARIFLRDLIEHATQRRFVYVHHWRPGDLVMWDNRVTMHRARRYNTTEVRDLHRVTVADSGPTLEQPA